MGQLTFGAYFTDVEAVRVLPKKKERILQFVSQSSRNVCSIVPCKGDKLTRLVLVRTACVAFDSVI